MSTGESSVHEDRKRIKRHTFQRLNLVDIKAQYAEHADLCYDVTKVSSAVCLRQSVFSSRTRLRETNRSFAVLRIACVSLRSTEHSFEPNHLSRQRGAWDPQGQRTLSGRRMPADSRSQHVAIFPDEMSPLAHRPSIWT